MSRPKEIQWFIITQILNVLLALYQAFANWDQLLASAKPLPPEAAIAVAVIASAIDLLLIYLIGARRNNIARWIYIVLRTIGVASLVASFSGAHYISSNAAETIMQLLLNAAGIILLLLPGAMLWFSRDFDNDKAVEPDDDKENVIS